MNYMLYSRNYIKCSYTIFPRQFLEENIVILLANSLPKMAQLKSGKPERADQVYHPILVSCYQMLDKRVHLIKL